jgi:Uma2 family endonuclease
MSQDTLASWSEPADAGPWMTADDLARLPDDARGYELVEGRLVRMSPTGGEHSYIAMDLGAVLHTFVKMHHLGIVLGAETGFLLSHPGELDTVLAPDVAFVRADRVPPKGSAEWRGFWRLAPDLVVEVASPSQRRPELAQKAHRWLAAGARLLWVIWPASREIDVWRPGADAPVMTFGIADTLDGLDVVPGFAYAIKHLFT